MPVTICKALATLAGLAYIAFVIALRALCLLIARAGCGLCL